MPAVLRFLLSVWFLCACGASSGHAETERSGSDNFNGNYAASTKLTQAEREYLQQLPPLRVPLIDNQPPLTFIQNDQPMGYLNELLGVIAIRLGLKINYYESSYADSIDALRSGNADLLNDYSSFADRENYLLKTQPVLSSPFVAVGSSDSIPVRGVDDLQNKRIVLVSQFQQTQTIQKKYPGLKTILVKNIDEAYRALRSNDADYYIDNATHAGHYLKTHLINDLKIVGEMPAEEIGKLELYFAVSKKHPMLYSAIEKTLYDLVKENVLLELRTKWRQRQEDRAVRLSKEEREWLSNHTEVRVVLDPDWAPVEYRTRSGDYEGISLDYLANLEKILGIKLNVINDLTWQQGVDALKSKQADMFASVARTPQREGYLLFTRPYIEMPISIFARDDVSYVGNFDNLTGKRIAVVGGYAIQDWINRDYPQLNLITVKTPLDGLRMVSKGEVDVFVGNVVTATYYIGKYNLNNVRVSGETGYTNNQSMAVRDDWPVLAGILQKALDVIPAEEKKSIYNRWMSIRFEHAVDYTLLAWVVLAGLLLLIAVFYWNRLLNRQVQSRTRDLAETESRFRDLFEKNSSVMLIMEPDSGNIIEANQSAADYYGYPHDTLVNMSVDEINTLPRDVVSQERIRAVSETKNYFNFKHRLSSGEERDVEVYATPIVSGNRPLLFSIIHDVTERKRAEEQIVKQANYDALTGLPNRILAMDRLNRLLSEAGRLDGKCAVMFVDLDDFKKINDSLGHDAGDLLLTEAAGRIQKTLRQVDTVGRLGGDEFIVLTGGFSEAADVIPIAEKILDCFKKSFFIQKRDLILTASIGVSVYPDDGRTATDMLRNADSAMYFSKENGRNTFAFFTEAMNSTVSRRLAIEEQMNGALERGEFSLCYQPKVSINSNQIIGVEALLRWHNSELGDMTPYEFIPVAEHSGLIVPIGKFVLVEALKTLAYCQEKLDPQISMAINFSPRQFRDPGLVDFIVKSVAQSGVPWKSVEMEITEGVIMTGLTYIEEAISSLSKMGVKLAMDDFGTGFSSLSHLRQFPFDVLKIDRSFVMDITVDDHDLELVNATIAMAHSLGLEVVAEGVETEEQLSILATQNCDIAQGYLFGKPVPADELFSILKQRTSN